MPETDKDLSRVPWREDQTKAVLDLYLRSAKIKKSFDDNDPEVIAEAETQKRSAGSIAYKLRNYRFLDSKSEAEGKMGLEGFSKRDVICWNNHSGIPLSNRAIQKIKEKGWIELMLKNRTVEIVPSSIAKALLSKPFLILTGPSGTGKTRGAVELAQLTCDEGCHALVAVGADWTDNRHVLGYLNPLETDAEKRPIYETTLILDLILHANDSAFRNQPHVLILDEMNLSHVERYFADFLSAMELEDKSGALKLHAAGTAVTRTGVPVEGRIDFPTNLFVIGTVNIDETTYMFSPKVLDRANVIEIHAEEGALGDFLRKIESADGGPKAKDYGIPFLDAAHAIQTEDEHAQVPLLPNAVRQAAADRLMVLFRIMKRGRGEYGFRTGKEVMAYLRTAHFLAGPEEAGRTAWAAGESWHEALDAQILQKILPKLHGSRSRLAPLLGALAQYCATGNEAYALEHFPGEDGTAPKRGLKDACATPNPVFKDSYEKLKRMIDVLVEEQFVSFIC